MKTLPSLLLMLMIMVISASATDDLPSKRSWLVHKLRSLGPLGPANWPSSGALYEFNTGSTYVVPSLSYYPQGAFAYVGQAGTEYYFQYANAGAYFPSDPDFANPSAYFHHYGLHEYTLSPWPQNYYFALAAESYNIAGLRYNGIAVYLNGDGYAFAPGQGYHTAWTFAPGNLLELAQAIETPVFRVTDYWFGDWNNFPQDVKLPQPQNTRSVTGGGFLLYPIHQWGLSMVWAKEGVYRPGYTYQPGYSAPRLHTYMQTYYAAAWRADPETGDLPRTSLINWDGRGFINDSLTQPAGQMDPGGYYFRPNQFGKVVLTTRAQETGFYGEVPAYTLGLLVDKNRDGTLNTNDVTTAQNPHTFWVNNDADRWTHDVLNLWDELDQNPGEQGTDAGFVLANNRIPSLRDLEDYDRLHSPGLRELSRDLPNGHTITLRWKNVTSGNPGIVVFRAVEANGGRNYLTDQTTASNQTSYVQVTVNGINYTFSPYLVGLASGTTAATLHTDSNRATNDFFLYCATGRGAGELALEVKKGAQTTAFQNDNPNQPYILYVHGWNMSAFDKDAFAETAFKRLY